jgi:hypothetical protein
MPSITITEKDNTVYGAEKVSNGDTVYVPGSAITGPYDHPVLCNSYADFVNTFGDHGCSNSKVWNYVTGILLGGQLSVLFQRVAESGSLTSNPTKLATSASVTVSTTGTTPVQLFKVEDIYGGTYGNSLSISMSKELTYIFFKVFYNGSLLENKKIASVTDSMTAPQISTAVFQSLSTMTFDTVKVNMIATSATFVYSDLAATSLTGGTDSDETAVATELATVYSTGNSLFGLVTDKYTYNIKFVSTGTYIDDAKNIAQSAVSLAEARGDCTAVIDMPLSVSQDNAKNYFDSIDSSYAVAFAPWCYIKVNNNSSYDWMPPSYAYFIALSSMMNTYNIWYPIAGVNRGAVPTISKTQYEVGGTLLSSWQDSGSQSINPIMKIRSFGYVIYGQRTLLKSLYTSSDNGTVKKSALRSLNVRITANEIKHKIFDACLSLSFEQDIPHTWNEFKSAVEPLLTQMKTDKGINDYEIDMDDNTTTTDDIQNSTINGTVKVAIVNTAEYFNIGFQLDSSSVKYTETTTDNTTVA